MAHLFLYWREAEDDDFLIAERVDRADNLYDARAMTSPESAWDLIDRCAAELGVHPETRRKWRERKSVPPRWQVPLLQQFGKHRLIVSLDFFDNLGPPADDAAQKDEAAAE